MKRAMICILAIAGAFSFNNAFAVDGKHINGRAVSVHWRSGSLDWGSACCGCSEGEKGLVSLFTIQNGSAVRNDTIYDGTQGFAYYPAFNLDGIKIAFYRSNQGKANSISCATANGGKNSVSVMDISGRNITNLCDLPCEIPSGGLDWPVGNWIYYIYPNCVRFSSDPRPMTQNNEVWKVNYLTKENVKICKYKGQGRDMPTCTYFRRFSLNLTADYMAVQALQKYLCTDPEWFCNNVVPFPGGCDVGAGGGNCNISISAGGGYTAYYYGTGHEFIDFGARSGSTKAPPSRVYLTEWQQVCADPIGIGCELIRWAVNSDKWVLQQVGWYGHAGNMGFGTNQVACNWSDMVAIRISANPKIAKSTSAGGDGTIYHGNCTGDMWIDGGAENIGKYEDGNGVWHSVPGYVPTAAEYMPVVKPSNGFSIDFANDNGIRSIRFSAGIPVAVSVFDVCGRMMMRSRPASHGPLRLSGFPRGSYIVNATTALQTTSRKIIIE